MVNWRHLLPCMKRWRCHFIVALGGASPGSAESADTLIVTRLAAVPGSGLLCISDASSWDET